MPEHPYICRTCHTPVKKLDVGFSPCLCDTPPDAVGNCSFCGNKTHEGPFVAYTSAGLVDKKRKVHKFACQECYGLFLIGAEDHAKKMFASKPSSELWRKACRTFTGMANTACKLRGYPSGLDKQLPLIK